GDRDRLHVAGGGPPGRGVDLQPRLHGRPGRRPAGSLLLHGGQSCRRPGLRLARPEDFVRVSNAPAIVAAEGPIRRRPVALLELAKKNRGVLVGLALVAVLFLLAFPALILAIALVAALGPSLRNAMIAIGIVAIPAYARLVRAVVLQLKQMEFVVATRSLGATPARIVLRHLIPNLMNPVLVQVSLSAGFAILAEAVLSFLGLGAQPPTP